jgi:hypothetical protein
LSDCRQSITTTPEAQPYAAWRSEITPIAGANKKTDSKFNRPPVKEGLTDMMGRRGQDRGNAAGRQLKSVGLLVHIMVIERNFTSEAQRLVRSAGAAQLLRSSFLFRHEFTARFRLRSSSYGPTGRSRSQSTPRRKRKGLSKNNPPQADCVLCELCGENIFLGIDHHV